MELEKAIIEGMIIAASEIFDSYAAHENPDTELKLLKLHRSAGYVTFEDESTGQLMLTLNLREEDHIEDDEVFFYEEGDRDSGIHFIEDDDDFLIEDMGLSQIKKHVENYSHDELVKIINSLSETVNRLK